MGVMATQVAGNYSVQFFVNGEAAGSPQLANVAPGPIDLEHLAVLVNLESTLSGSSASIVAGEASVLQISGSDAFGNLESLGSFLRSQGQNFSLSFSFQLRQGIPSSYSLLTDPQAFLTVPPQQAAALPDGTILASELDSITIVPYVAGELHVDITLVAGGSSYDVSGVLSVAASLLDLFKTLVYGPGLSGAINGVSTVFYILPKDQLGNVKVSGFFTLKPNIKKSFCSP